MLLNGEMLTMWEIKLSNKTCFFSKSSLCESFPIRQIKTLSFVNFESVEAYWQLQGISIFLL